MDYNPSNQARTISLIMIELYSCQSYHTKGYISLMLGYEDDIHPYHSWQCYHSEISSSCSICGSLRDGRYQLLLEMTQEKLRWSRNGFN